jgi:hypothetical protein
MNKHKHPVIAAPRNSNTLWPDESYYTKLETLQRLIGRKIFLIEAVVTEINAGIHHTGHAYTLLAIVDFPQPDPKTGLLPHNIILDDGRGINLGRIIQISIESAFTVAEKNIIYKNDNLLNNLLPHYNSLDKKTLTQISKAMLANILGKTEAASATQKLSNTRIEK